ncbi:hypothetical protein W97_08185 [Coniosporium apollinis CBS 100218]|uniref:Uncharacterized protein n=1 Tax=Coniosporium apollinis (strain CBS 100218) TaxID=1168221 RepID=R7Z433_CONA1|nr:uncharacterized protein W97_08185 [Coniosporium apollinis CBS 100218]EON68927.1 hypothetical protein W97_08185 [Coniosporium apollinis CBS 100218]
MSATNGVLTPPSPLGSTTASTSTSTSATKRKRSSSGDHGQINGIDTRQNAEEEAATATESRSQALFADILELLKSYDTTPSLLHHPLTDKTHRSTSGEPTAKRKRLSQSSEPTSIAARLQEGTYSSLDELVEDVDAASSALLEPLKAREAAKSPGKGSKHDRPTPEHSPQDTRLITGTLAFKKVLNDIILRRSQIKPRVTATRTEPGSVNKSPALTNGIKEEPAARDFADALKDGRTVLTLYANAQGPRQLFSSLQTPTRVGPSPDTPSSNLDIAVGVTLPLPEDSLPNVLSTTKILKENAEDAVSGKKRGPTFGDLFAPPASVPKLSPPKPAKQSTTRGSTVQWAPHDAISRGRRGSTYTTQPLTTGQWLGYGGVDAPQEPSSPTAKRRQRDRALSTGESKPPLSEADAAVIQQAKADALFRSVYSSFAPSRDDAIAIVPEELKSRMWWHKAGENRLLESAIDPALLALQPGQAAGGRITDGQTEEDEDFKAAIEDFEPETIEGAYGSEVADKQAREVEEILRDISELLETLHSYQRIRNATLTSTPRTPAAQSAPIALVTGSPSSPSEAEIDVYKMLKTQLSLMIATLPPYAVAKLDGEQLAELNISKNIMVETKDYRGVMEEDAVSLLVKSALSAAAGATTPRVSSGGAAHPSQYSASSSQYARPPSSVQVPIARSAAHPASYLPHQQPPARTPSGPLPRSSSGNLSYPATYPSSTPRPSYGSATYAQQTPRASYSQSNSQQYYQQPSTQPKPAYTPHQYYQSTPTSQYQNRYQPNPSAYQPRPPSTQPAYNNYTASSQSPHPRTASPLKAPLPPTSTAQGQYTQPRSSASAYATPATNPSQHRQYYQPSSTATNQALPAPPPPPPAQQYMAQPATPSALGPTGYHTSMTTAEQQIMMDRQRAQLAMQPGAAAGRVPQANMGGRASGTPQPGVGTPGGPTGGGLAGQGQVNGTAVHAS